jgi:hypothetical protein
MKWTHEVPEVSAEQKLSILVLRCRIKIFIESLILAQDERWRRA